VGHALRRRLRAILESGCGLGRAVGLPAELAEARDRKRGQQGKRGAAELRLARLAETPRADPDAHGHHREDQREHDHEFPVDEAAPAEQAGCVEVRQEEIGRKRRPHPRRRRGGQRHHRDDEEARQRGRTVDRASDEAHGKPRSIAESSLLRPGEAEQDRDRQHVEVDRRLDRVGRGEFEREHARRIADEAAEQQHQRAAPVDVLPHRRRHDEAGDDLEQDGGRHRHRRLDHEGQSRDRDGGKAETGIAAHIAGDRQHEGGPEQGEVGKIGHAERQG